MSAAQISPQSRQMVAAITEKVAESFRTFGGGRGSDFNPLAAALKDRPLQFAAGVSVDDVVLFVMAEVFAVLSEIVEASK